MSKRSSSSGGFLRSVQFQLIAASLGLVALLSFAAFWMANGLVRGTFQTQSDGLAIEDAQRQSRGVASTLNEAETIAQSLVALYQSGERGPDAVRRFGQSLLARSAQTNGVVGLGLWPEPGAFTPGTQRQGFQWLMEQRGSITLRDDYNDPERISYFNELWYSVARFTSPDGCHWSGIRAHLLLKQPVVTCTIGLWRNDTFQGAVTLDLLPEVLDAVLARELAGDRNNGYNLLFDADGTLVAAAGAVGALREQQHPEASSLAQRQPGLNPMAVSLYRIRDNQVQQAIDSNRYEASELSELRDNTRKLSRDDAEHLFAGIWSRSKRLERPGDPQPVRLETDPVQGEASKLLLTPVSKANWTLVVARSANAGMQGVGALTRQLLLITTVFVVGAVVLLLALIQLRLVHPLQQMTRKARSAGEGKIGNLVFNARARSEVGELGYWLNQRERHLADVIDRGETAATRLSLEISERQAVSAQLAVSEQRLDAALKSAEEGFIGTDRGGQINFVNPAAEALMGVSQNEAIGHALTEILHLRRPEEDGVVQDFAAKAMSAGKRITDPDPLELQTPDGHPIPVRVTAAPIRDAESNLLGAIIVLHRAEITTGAAQAGPATADLGRDPLTGLFGRATFTDDASALLEQAELDEQPHTLAMLDVDQMRGINSQYGETAGTELLQHLAQVINTEVGGSGRTYRLGADRFLAVYRNTPLDAAESRIEQLRETIDDSPLRWEGNQITPSVSVGLVRVEASARTAMGLLKRAESAVRNAKGGGGGQTRRYRGEDNQQKQRVADDIWVSRIQTGLDDSMFHLMTQPIAALQHGGGEGMEVFVSLEDEEGFWATPESFMPAARRAGLAADIDRWVIQETFTALADLIGDGTPQFAFCGVNLSDGALRDPTFLNYLFEAFQNHAVPPNRICFEIDERIAQANTREVQELTTAMRGIGCRFTVDNYHSGIEGAGILRDLRADFVKLDQATSLKVAGEKFDQIALESLVRVLQEMEIGIIATRIDDDAARKPLADLGVQFVQGYAIGRPAPIMLGLAKASG